MTFCLSAGNGSSRQMRVLFFSPAADIWPHSLPEAKVAQVLASAGAEVHFVRCDEDLRPHCLAMSAEGLRANSVSRHQRNQICRSCKSTQRTIDHALDCTVHKIGDFCSPNNWDVCTLVNSATRDNWFDLEFEGLQIGRLAAYEFFLENKLNTLDIPQGLWSEYLGYLRNAVLVAVAATRIIDIVRPDRVIVYNDLYSVNRVVTFLARDRGIAAFRLHGGPNVQRMLDTLTITKSIDTYFQAVRSEEWEQASHLPLDRDSIREVGEYQRFLLKGTGAFVYSSSQGANSADELRSLFNVLPHQKVLICTTSSEDEMIAAKLVGVDPRDNRTAGLGCLFETQAEWLRHVIDISKRNSDWKIIIRIHPREFPNRRESQMSQNAETLMRLLRDIPSNVAINWPDQGVSLYDLAQITDVCLNGISNAGAEMLSFGIPVVVHNPHELFSYPSEHNFVPESIETYESTVRDAIVAGWDFENIRNAFRWRAFQFQQMTVDVNSGGAIWPPRSLLRILKGIRNRYRVPIPIALEALVRRRALSRVHLDSRSASLISDVILNNRDGFFCSPLNRQEVACVEDETKELREELRKLLTLMQVPKHADRCLSQTIEIFLDSADGS
jgi:hypothetical protein